MKTWFNRLFSPNHFLKAQFIQGHIPSDREVFKTSMQIAWPSTMESLLVSLIGAVDMIMVGTIGASAIAAVGITNQPKFILMALVLSLNMGVTVIVSRRKGQDNRKEAIATLRSALTCSILINIVMSFIGIVFAKDILTLAGANAEYISLAVPYFQLVMIGNVFGCTSLTINAAQRGIGNTKISMRTNLTSNIINLIFNFLLINGIWIFPKMGVVGAGVATMLGNIIACGMSFYSILDHENYLFSDIRSQWLPKRNTIKDLMHIASPAFVEQIFLRIGFFLYSATVAGLGTLAFATHQICMNIISISFSIGDGLSIANSSLVGQMLGAKRSDMAMIYSRTTQIIGMCMGFVLAMVLVLFRKDLIGLFTSDADIIRIGSDIMFIIVATVLFQITQVITAGGLRGAGDVRFTAMLSLVSTAILRPSLTYILAYPLGLGLIGAWIALFLDQVIRFSATFLRFKTGKWMKIKV
ncbi:MAG: MATE family efflux transporter [Erysipelotrichaceae bacterium]